MNILPEYITEEKWIKMSSVYASRDYVVNAECNANMFHISLLLGDVLTCDWRTRDNRGRGRKLIYLVTYF